MDHASGISTEYYKVFYYVGRLGSITAAAEALCISQPAASQAIKQLEKALNTKLFFGPRRVYGSPRRESFCIHMWSAGWKTSWTVRRC